MTMTGSMETSFKQALKKPPSQRTTEDLHTVYCHLYHMDVLSHLREHQLRSDLPLRPTITPKHPPC
ncbi:unnamed protein product [Oncorhynchus mykiss]|uniref:Uncharacterized protein n=1 Tax=Oncorhynchus mykiss TaxID=8022 RepID=A0A060WXF9_ONCMY|nr:unnamed protein product [Oncorhynchus mykiss]